MTFFGARATFSGVKLLNRQTVKAKEATSKAIVFFIFFGLNRLNFKILIKNHLCIAPEIQLQSYAVVKVDNPYITGEVTVACELNIVLY
ncbi:hypothetical protein ASU31_04740 [Pedobacter ginsenosidimutans]|uniref:Uncharacterized protein n=1 Tax=Pedobacter ginsenosidimutans TaxID=687842 RepID=A0A0T5VTC2_9SPHI|nr:hypothetical protein ASU31_04740 [Pedobacter ginsenosidimutans]